MHRFLPRRLLRTITGDTTRTTHRHHSSSNTSSSTTTNSIWAFGDNTQGALGLPSPPYSTFSPTPIASLPGDLTHVAAGHYHSLAVTTAGEIYAWGRNEEGQLGRGGASSSSSPRRTWGEPKRVEGLDGVRVRSAFASGVVSAAVGEDGSLWVWGRSKRGQLGLGRGLVEATVPTRVEALAGKNVAKLVRSTHVESEGPQDFNSVMEVIEKEVSEELEKESNMPIVWEPHKLNGIEVSDIACGLDHSLVLCRNGMLLSSGNNIYGQLGRAGDGSRLLPVDMVFKPLSVSAGLGHSLALCQIPSADTSKVVTGIASWGWNWGSQLGRSEGQEDLPAIVGNLNGRDIVSISGGRAHSIALTSNSEVWVWGSGRNGRLGLGSSADEEEPAMLDCLDGVEILQAVSGFDHNIILVADSY